MKKLMFTLILLAPGFIALSQVKDTVHLSYNLNEYNHCLKKLKAENGLIHFYINDQHFTSVAKNSKNKQMTCNEINRKKILNISQFLKLAYNERKRLIEEGEKNKSIKILFNHQVFDQIYLYEKINDKVIKRYDVIWVEEIE